MFNYFIISTTVALLAIFLDNCMEDGNILSGYSRFLDTFPDYLAKPLGKCIICMSFWLAVLTYMLFSLYFPYNIALAIMHIGTVGGLVSIYKKIENIFYEDAT